MTTTTKKLKLKLSKFENVQIIYITPLGQYWGICSNSIKKCIIKKKNTYLPVLEEFLLNKKIISYKNSKLFKKGVKFTFGSKGIKLATKKKIFIIEILSKRVFTFIDLFSGAGGFSLGLKKSGLKHLYGVDS
jgi:hypothetical protein